MLFVGPQFLYTHIPSSKLFDFLYPKYIIKNGAQRMPGLLFLRIEIATAGGTENRSTVVVTLATKALVPNSLPDSVE